MEVAYDACNFQVTDISYNSLNYIIFVNIYWMVSFSLFFIFIFIVLIFK
jgi:hypothetical protein